MAGAEPPASGDAIPVLDVAVRIAAGVLDPAGQARGCGDDREPGVRAGRL